VSELILGGKETRRLIAVVKVGLSLECSIITARDMKMRVSDLLLPKRLLKSGKINYPDYIVSNNTLQTQINLKYS